MRKYCDYFEWDVNTWSLSLKLWRDVLREMNLTTAYALDLGGRGGGMSLFLAREFGYNVICSDLENPRKVAFTLHEKYGLTEKISYAAIDCTKIAFQDNTFDIVIFKSVLGALGTYERQRLAISEMFRVLKPGGVILFAENVKGSYFHRWLRVLFVTWGNSWRYVDYKKELNGDFFKNFSYYKVSSNGYFSLLCRNEKLRLILNLIDKVLMYLVPKKYRYMAFGYAIK